MTVYRQWFCNCHGLPQQLDSEVLYDHEAIEPACKYCGATPSSDPKKMLSFRDQEEWDD
jgi:hypothetical protein